MNYKNKEKYKLYALISLLITFPFIPFVSYDFLYFFKTNDVIKVIISLLFLVISIFFAYKFFRYFLVLQNIFLLKIKYVQFYKIIIME